MQSKLLVALCALTCGVIAGAAQAQVIEPMMPVPPLPVGPEAPPQPGQSAIIGKTVTDRARPEIDPLGMRFGEFFFFPRAEIDGSYNDNIFATNNGQKGSWITTFVPSFDLISNMPQNLIVASGGAAIGRYSSQGSEDFNDAYGSLGGRLDMTALTHILANLRVDRLHEPRTSPDSPGLAAQPVTYTTENGDLGIEQTGTRIGYRADATVTRWDYEATPAVGGGNISQDDRNETGLEGALRVYYEFMPDYQAFIRGSGNSQNYDHAAGVVAGVNIPKRDSTGYRLDAGARIDLTGVTYMEVYGGWLQQDFQSPLFSSIGGVDFGTAIVWNFTTLDTLKLNSTRTVNSASAEVAGIALSPGYLATNETVSLDHELLRNLLLNINGGYEVDDWKNINRTDNIFDFGLGAKYMMNRNLYFGASWTFQQRNSSGAAAGVPYSQNILMFRVSTQL